MAESKNDRSRKSRRGSTSKSSAKSSGGKSSGGKSSNRKSSNGASASSGSSSRKGQSAREVVISAIEQVQDLIGRPVESVTGMEKNGSEWNVTLEVLELERVPNTTDVLGKYEVTVDKDGEVTSANRTRRYNRAEAGEV
jgi:hypothetical protein